MIFKAFLVFFLLLSLVCAGGGGGDDGGAAALITSGKNIFELAANELSCCGTLKTPTESEVGLQIIVI